MKKIEKILINDLNPTALKIAEDSASLNNLKNIEFSEKEACVFLNGHSRKGNRGTLVDIDPFGSPAAFFDCGIRATMHGGILSTAATDLQVLNGLFQGACKRKYGGIPVTVEYGNEMAIRLILGSLRSVAARLGVKMIPMFVESEMHYYRTYVKILNRIDQEENLGFIIHCKNCGHRKTALEQQHECELCKLKTSIAGPLWIGKIFDKEYVNDMIEEMPIAYMRGINIDNSITIIDEAQNISIDNIRTIMTRLGENSKMIFLGDENQIDMKKKNESSLNFIIDKFKDFDEVGTVVLGEDDVVRNPLIKKIEQIFRESKNQ